MQANAAYRGAGHASSHGPILQSPFVLHSFSPGSSIQRRPLCEATPSLLITFSKHWRFSNSQTPEPVIAHSESLWHGLNDAREHVPAGGVGGVEFGEHSSVTS